MKAQRWYEIVGDRAMVYNAPRPENATAASVVRLGDLKYYRNNFSLSKIWEKEL